jgi:hypothetical protein
MTQGDDVLDFVIRGKDEFSPTAKKASESALTAARDIDRANAQVSRSADDTTHHMTGMSRGISGAGDVARVSGGHFTSMGGALSKTGEHARTAGGHFGVLGTALSGLTSPFRRATSQAEGFASTLVKLSGLGSIIATGLGAGLAAGAVALAKFQLSQEDLWDSIQGNIGATDKQMNVMRQSANRLARETGQALETVAHGFERASNFGYKGAEGFKVVETAAKAAQITGGQTADVVNVLGRVMANFNVPARDAAKTMNILVASNAQANSSLDVFGMNFQRVSSYAAGLKIPLTQASGAFALLARNMPAAMSRRCSTSSPGREACPPQHSLPARDSRTTPRTSMRQRPRTAIWRRRLRRWRGSGTTRLTAFVRSASRSSRRSRGRSRPVWPGRCTPSKGC